MKKIVALSLLIAGVMLFAAATKPTLYRKAADEVKRVVGEEKFGDSGSKSTDHRTEVFREGLKDRFHDFVDSHFTGDAKPIKDVGDSVIDHAGEVPLTPGHAFIIASGEATVEKDNVYGEDGKERLDLYVSGSVVPGLPKDVGAEPVPSGPEISARVEVAPTPAGAEPISLDLPGMLQLVPSQPASDRRGVGPNGHEGGVRGDWAGPDAHGPEVENHGNIS